ncbi:TetR/AcrR family transcriptional regulator [Puteibacter caeruleilacunae]|nr:TetR/AcrR family transcriptional regulator [Puteibacter caeruleilacunae]
MAKSEKTEIHDRVFNVAMDMMRRYGLRGMNMSELAKRSNLAKATLYKIIGTKENLVDMVAYHIYDINTKTLLKNLLEYEDPEIAVTAFLDEYLNFSVASQRVLVLQIYKEYPALEEKYDRDFEERMCKVEEVFEEWYDKGMLNHDINVNHCIESLRALNDFYVESDYSDKEVIDRLRSGFRCIFNGMGIKI